MSKLGKTLDKEIDKGTKKLDENTSKAIGMPEGTKIGHAMDGDSAKHKEAVKSIKGQENPSEKEGESPVGIAGDTTETSDAVV